MLEWGKQIARRKAKQQGYLVRVGAENERFANFRQFKDQGYEMFQMIRQHIREQSRCGRVCKSVQTAYGTSLGDLDRKEVGSAIMSVEKA